jgi:FKBP-type peptidyl-prolyl cis-trans isomerase
MNEKTTIVFILLVSCLLFGAAWWANTSKATQAGAVQETPDLSRAKLNSVDTKVGTEAEAVPGKKVTVNYTGKLADGTIFDSSVTRNQPFSFTLGAGEVIQGWEIGIQGMKVGGTRVLTIPPELGYGAMQMGSIPPNSTLTFTVDLLKVE